MLLSNTRFWCLGNLVRCNSYCVAIQEKSNIQKPKGYWNHVENVNKFMLEIKAKYNLQTTEDWENLSFHQILGSGGGVLFKKYSIYELKSMACPEIRKTRPDKQKPKGFWDDNENINKFLEELKDYYNLETIDDWNNLKLRDIQKLGGSGLLNKYKLFDIKCMGNKDIKTKFSHETKYNRRPCGYWDKLENIHNFLVSLKEKLDISSVDDWNRVSNEQIREFGGSGLLNKFSLSELCCLLFPNEKQSIMFNEPRSKRSAQRFLFIQVKKIFEGEEIVEDYFHSDLSRISSFPIQFDIFLPNKNIAFEYQGRQHFEDISAGFAPIEMYKLRDIEKLKLTKKAGIKLYIIPHWWDRCKSSLLQCMEEN